MAEGYVLGSTVVAAPRTPTLLKAAAPLALLTLIGGTHRRHVHHAFAPTLANFSEIGDNCSAGWGVSCRQAGAAGVSDRE